MTQDKHQDPLDEGFQRIFGKFERVEDKQGDIDQLLCMALYGVPTQELDAGRVSKFIDLSEKLAPAIQRYTEQREDAAVKRYQQNLISNFAYDIEVAELDARIDAYADCGSKAGSGTVVRAYAKSRAHELEAQRQSLEDKVKEKK